MMGVKAQDAGGAKERFPTTLRCGTHRGLKGLRSWRARAEKVRARGHGQQRIHPRGHALQDALPLPGGHPARGHVQPAVPRGRRLLCCPHL